MHTTPSTLSDASPSFSTRGIPTEGTPPPLPMSPSDEKVAKDFPAGKLVCHGNLSVSGTHIHYELKIGQDGARDVQVSYTEGQFTFEGSAHYGAGDESLYALMGAVQFEDSNVSPGQSRSWLAGCNLQKMRVALIQRGTMGGWTQTSDQCKFTMDGTPAGGGDEPPDAPPDPPQPGPGPESMPGSEGPESPGNGPGPEPGPSGPAPESVPGASGPDSPGTSPDPGTPPGPTPESQPGAPDRGNPPPVGPPAPTPDKPTSSPNPSTPPGEPKPEEPSKDDPKPFWRRKK